MVWWYVVWFGVTWCDAVWYISTRIFFLIIAHARCLMRSMEAIEASSKLICTIEVTQVHFFFLALLIV